MKKHSIAGRSLLARLASGIRHLHARPKKKTKEKILDSRIEETIARKIEGWLGEKKHLDHTIFVYDVAEDFGVTTQELSAYFSAKFGKRFYSWRNEQRIEEAKTLLLVNPATPLCRIGAMVGIPDKSDFRKLFRRVTGCTPGEWRAMNGYPVHKSEFR